MIIELQLNKRGSFYFGDEMNLNKMIFLIKSMVNYNNTTMWKPRPTRIQFLPLLNNPKYQLLKNQSFPHFTEGFIPTRDRSEPKG